MNLGAALSIGSGLLGAISGANANRQAGRTMAAAEREARERAATQARMRQIAEGYDPAAETERAVRFANEMGGAQLERSLGEMNARFARLGGDPAGDTRFRLDTAGEARRIFDPIREFAAMQRAGETGRKLQAFQVALGSGEDMTRTFLGLSEAQRRNTGPSFDLLSTGLRDMGILRPRGRGRDELPPMNAMPDRGVIV